jgi:hypothetical protein
MHQEDDTSPAVPRIGGGYPAAQLARALAHASVHDDPQTQERVRRWTDALMGVLGGSIAPGDRRPVANLPVWVTLEVVTGGFATGKAMSAGPLRPHEQQLLCELGLADAPNPRLALNCHFLSAVGLRRLADALKTSRYDVEVPEEAALLVVAWLVEHGLADEARELIGVLAPYLGDLRFYPALTEVPRSSGPLVHLEDVGAVSRRLQGVRQNRRVLAQREAIEIWTPLYDRLIATFLETVTGEVPVAQKDELGAWRRGASGQFVVEGGWPCAQYPEGWRVRAAALLTDFRAAREEHRLCGRAARRNEVLAMLENNLGRALDHPDQLTGRDVGQIRLALARYVAVRGVPASERARQLRSRQWRHATAPTHQEIARHVANRLASLRQNEGVDDIGALAADVEPGAVSEGALRRGGRVPPSVVRKLERCVRDSVDGLVKRGIVPSGEVLAQVLPQITSGLRAAGIADRALRDLYAAHYRAFRRRRSLLLLDLQKQVQIEELPWVRSIDRHRSADLPAAELSKHALVETSVLAMSSFPQAMLPNKLVRELEALARTANVDVPLTEELAADIFMGQFSPKFIDAVRTAAAVLRGSLYARYYGIDYDQAVEVLTAEKRTTSRQARGPDVLARLCAERAGAALGTWRPAVNGRIIEQQLILTTHNLAALTTVPGVRDALADRWDGLARRCFDWVLAQLQLPEAGHHVALIRIKNAAYAWRQMVFFLSCGSGGVAPFLRWADERVDEQPVDFRGRFRPALRGLACAAGIDEAGDHGGPSCAQVFLGWVDGRHWLMRMPAAGASGDSPIHT